jgi:hypothetical protein
MESKTLHLEKSAQMSQKKLTECVKGERPHMTAWVVETVSGSRVVKECDHLSLSYI